jgi:hypothetical protein
LAQTDNKTLKFCWLAQTDNKTLEFWMKAWLYCCCHVHVCKTTSVDDCMNIPPLCCVFCFFASFGAGTPLSTCLSYKIVVPALTRVIIVKCSFF